MHKENFSHDHGFPISFVNHNIYEQVISVNPVYLHLNVVLTRFLAEVVLNLLRKTETIRKVGNLMRTEVQKFPPYQKRD